MKSVTVALVLLCGLALSTPAPGQTHDQPSAAHASLVALMPAPAHRWQPDTALREGMRQARTAVTQLHQGKQTPMSSAAVVQQASAVEAAVSYMFAHCSLAEEPDAALHSILLPLLHAAQTLKSEPDNDAAVADMRALLALYPHYFDDPGW